MVQIFLVAVEVYSGAASRQEAVPAGAPSWGFLFSCLGSPADLAALYLFPPIPVDAADSPSFFCGPTHTGGKPRRESAALARQSKTHTGKRYTLIQPKVEGSEQIDENTEPTESLEVKKKQKKKQQKEGTVGEETMRRRH